MKRLFAHIGFSCAVSLLVLNLIPFQFVLPILAGLCVLFAAAIMIKKYRQALCVPVCLASAIFSTALFICFYKSSVEPCLMLDGKSSETLLYITSLAQKTANGYAYTAKTIQIDTQGAVQNITVRLISDEQLTVKPYRIIKANTSFFSLGEQAFSSHGYWSRNIYLSAVLNSYSLTDLRVKSVLEPLLSLRADMISTIKSSIPSDAGTLSAALLTGDKTGLSDNANSMFKAAGASHLMAVSGLHLSVSVGFAVGIMKKLRVHDKAVFAVSVFLVFCYCAVAGFSKSVVRAGIMMLVMLLGNAVGKRGDTLNSLGFALFLLCLNPFAVSDIGMSLSVLAVLAICTLYPELNKYAYRLHNVRDKPFVKAVKQALIYILNAFFLSLSIMIYTLPVMYVYFGYVSIAGLVSNIILSPLGSCALVASLISYGFSGVPTLNTILFDISEFLCKTVLNVVKAFAGMQYATVHLGNAFALVLAGVLLIFAFCFFLCNKRLMKRAAAVCSVIVVVFVSITTVMSDRYMTMYICPASSVVIKDKDAIIVCYADDRDYYAIDNYLASHGRTADCLFVSGNSCSRAAGLSAKYECSEIISVSFDPAYLTDSAARSVIVAPNYKTVAESLFFSYNCTDKEAYYVLNYRDANILIGEANGENFDIVIGKNYVYDTNGSIDLSKGNAIEYTISSKNTFTVRRVDAWQD